MKPETAPQLDRLEADKTLKSACVEFAQEIRAAAQAEAEVVARSERLTREDLTIVINARAEDLPTEGR